MSALGAPGLLYLIAALLGSVDGTRDRLPGAGGSTDIPLIHGPIHHDILLPLAPDARAMFDGTGTLARQMRHPDATYLMVGWGARQFYTTVGTYRDLSWRAVWRGATGDTSVMRAVVTGPVPPGTITRSMTLPQAQFSALLSGIQASFAATNPLEIDGHGDVFYPAHGTFHLFRTCNVWVGNQLRAAGVQFGWWTPTPFSVRLSHWLYHGP